MKIKQTYRGNGGKEGYRFELYQGNEKVTIIKQLPSEIHIGSTVEIGGVIYTVGQIYDCEESPQEEETVWYVLTAFVPDFRLNTL